MKFQKTIEVVRKSIYTKISVIIIVLILLFTGYEHMFLSPDYIENQYKQKKDLFIGFINECDKYSISSVHEEVLPRVDTKYYCEHNGLNIYSNMIIPKDSKVFEYIDDFRKMKLHDILIDQDESEFAFGNIYSIQLIYVKRDKNIESIKDDFGINSSQTIRQIDDNWYIVS